jgi:predicted kinase
MAYIEAMKELITYLLVGPPGSGKSTWGKEFVQKNPNTIRLCPDEFRAKFGTSESDQSVSAQAFSATRSEMRNALLNEKSVLIDATNMYRKTRKDFIDIAKIFDAKTIAVVFECDKATLLARNINRGSEGGRNVPEHVIDNMLNKYQRPDKSEFDEVNFVNKKL